MKGTKRKEKERNSDSKKLSLPHDQNSSRSKVETRRRDEKSTPPPSENLRATYISVPLIRLFFFHGLSPLGETIVAVRIRPGIVCIGRPYQPISGNEIAAAD